MVEPGHCVFCDIVAGIAPASVVYEDDDFLSFLTTEPVTPGHLLVIPKEHAPYLSYGIRLITVRVLAMRRRATSGNGCGL